MADRPIQSGARWGAPLFLHKLESSSGHKARPNMERHYERAEPGRIARHRYSGRRLGQELRHWQQYGPCPARREREFRTRQIHRHHGPVRLRQIHAYAHARRPRLRHIRAYSFRRGRPDPHGRQAAHLATSPQDRLHLPKLQPVAHVHRRTEHPHATDSRRRQARPRLVRPARRYPGTEAAPEPPTE